jgi:hypothetical protein
LRVPQREFGHWADRPPRRLQSRQGGRIVNPGPSRAVIADMIVYELVCAHGHRFEGWFASAEEFVRQHEATLVACPLCDDVHVERVPSARVAVAKGVARDNEPAETPADRDGESTAIAGLPAEVVAKLKEIVHQTENVGRRFPEEARKIHYEEIPARPIRGQASPEEADELREEGIEFASLPPFLTRESH